MSRTPDRRDQRKPNHAKPAPGQRLPKPGDWVNALIKQMQERRK